MKKILVATTMLIFAMVGSASADLITSWTDNKTFTETIINNGGSFGYTHTLIGFDTKKDVAENYTLTVTLKDDNQDSGWLKYEVAWVDQPGIIGDGLYYNFAIKNKTFGMSLLGLAQINTSGKLDVTIRSIFGDFVLTQSDLNVSGYTASVGTAPVPEPATALLVGLGLAGLVGYNNRKRFMKKA